MRAWPHAVISSLGVRARGGGGQAPAFRVARCQTWSHVDIRLGPVGSRQGSSGLVGDPYGSVSWSYTDTGPSSHPSGLVGSCRDISATPAKVRSGPKTSNLVRSGSRIDGLARNKDQMNRIACPDPSGLLLRPKTAEKKCLRKTAPGGPGGPRRPPSLLSAQAGAYV